MSSAKTTPQDMPPQGGYAAYQIDRITLRSLFRGRVGLTAFVAANVIGWPLYYQNWVDVRKKFLEKKSTELALVPIIYAERDRTMLKHMRRLRDLEDDVMKDFPFWETGTFFGTPIFESLPKDTYIDPMPIECYTYAEPYYMPVMAWSFMYT